MRVLWGWVMALLVVGIASGCGKVRECREGTVLVTVNLDAVSSGADTLAVQISVDGKPAMAGTAPHTPGEAKGTLALEFQAGFPSGKAVVFTVTARKGGATIGSGGTSLTLGAGCSTTSVDVSATGVDGGTDAGVTPDLADLAGPVDLADLAGPVDLGPDQTSAVDLLGDGTQVPDMTSACPYIHVAPTGNNNDSGCSPSSAKLTIAAGVTTATSMGVAEVRVCKGTYTGFSATAGTVSIQGGFDCSTWMRTTNHGYPTFDGVNTSVLTTPTASNQTVRLLGGNVTLGGFTITGPSTNSPATISLLINGGAHTVTDNKILGGTSSSFGTVGVQIDSGNVDLVGNTMDGGAGNATSGNGIGSIGLNVTNGALAHVHGNTINGGSGVGATGSIGLAFFNKGTYTAASGRAPEKNKINGGTGTGGTFQGTFGCIGLLISADQTSNIEIEVLENQIDGGAGSLGRDGTTAVRIYNGAGPTVLARNRIFGGRIIQASAASGTSGVNVWVGSPLLVNNMIHAGDTINAKWTYGVITEQGGITIRHNTILSGDALTPKGAIFLSHPVVGYGAVIENNILAMGPAVVLGACADRGPIASWRNNVTFGNEVMSYGSTVATPCSPTNFFNIDVIEAEILNKCTATTSGSCMTFGGAKATNNLVLRTGCTDGGCRVFSGCATGASCAQALLTYDSTQPTVDLFGPGWMLKASTPCAVTRSGLDDIATHPIDLYNTTRTPLPSMGAHEFDGTCL